MDSVSTVAETRVFQGARVSRASAVRYVTDRQTDGRTESWTKRKMELWSVIVCCLCAQGLSKRMISYVNRFPEQTNPNTSLFVSAWQLQSMTRKLSAMNECDIRHWACVLVCVFVRASVCARDRVFMTSTKYSCTDQVTCTMYDKQTELCDSV